MKVLNAKKNGAARNAGFTIIELVVVILLLGILAATALPRFIDVTDDAYDAAVEGVYGGFATGVGLFRAQWVANGQPNNVAVSSFGDGTAFTANITTGSIVSAGYPVGTDADFTEAGDCVRVWNGVLQGGRPAIAASADPTGITSALREAAVEAAVTGATNDPTYIAVPNSTTDAVKTGCLYYYVGRFGAGTPSNAVTIPFISYSAVNGNITLNEQIFDN